MRTLDAIRKIVTEDDIRPTVSIDGVPHCSRDACPSYDGKRCKAMGHRPDGICEPAVGTMARTLAGNEGVKHGQ